MTQDKNNSYQLRLNLSLYNLILQTSLHCDISPHEIIRKTARWVNKGNWTEELKTQIIKNDDSKHKTLDQRIQTRNCVIPECSSDDFRMALEFRCTKALQTPKVQAFKTELKNGIDYIIIDDSTS